MSANEIKTQDAIILEELRKNSLKSTIKKLFFEKNKKIPFLILKNSTTEILKPNRHGHFEFPLIANVTKCRFIFDKDYFYKNTKEIWNTEITFAINNKHIFSGTLEYLFLLLKYMNKEKIIEENNKIYVPFWCSECMECNVLLSSFGDKTIQTRYLEKNIFLEYQKCDIEFSEEYSTNKTFEENIIDFGFDISSFDFKGLHGGSIFYNLLGSEAIIMKMDQITEIDSITIDFFHWEIGRLKFTKEQLIFVDDYIVLSLTDAFSNLKEFVKWVKEDHKNPISKNGGIMLNNFERIGIYFQLKDKNTNEERKTHNVTLFTLGLNKLVTEDFKIYKRFDF